MQTTAVHAAAPPEWQQPEVVAVNREPMKATFFNFESTDKAIAGDAAASKYYLSLYGTSSYYTPVSLEDALNGVIPKPTLVFMAAPTLT